MARKSRRQPRAEKRAEQARHAQPSSNPQAKSSTGMHSPKPAAEMLREAAASANPFEPMERFMQAFMPLAWVRPWMMASGSPAPKLDVIDRDGSVLVRAEVPGVQKGHLAVEASDVAVTIKGEIAHDETHESDDYRISETSRGAFERTVRLPADVDSTRAKATFKDGVVEVMLPKVDRSRSHHVKL
jgi:HSP20 family protein